jgi:pimeloyl-ACP methyl ester carboxylesterase
MEKLIRHASITRFAERYSRMLSIMTAALLAAATANEPAAADYVVREIGSFHLGGRQATLTGLPTRDVVFSPGSPVFKVDPNGEFEADQMYVQFVKLAQPRAKVPILFWHGGGLTGVTWETKPDGKPGWQQWFLNAGYDVYVSDAVERGRASWARYPEIYKSEPLFRTKKEAWELFRFGPSYEVGGRRATYDGVQFPVDAFDQFMKQGVPRWVTNDAATLAAYDALVQKVCPCIVVVHSQGGNFGFTAALNAPDKIKALIAVEPSGAPDPAKVDVARVKNLPHLIVWGDFLDKNTTTWPGLVRVVTRYREALLAAGAKADVFDLPTMGIKGNTHMLMMDANSDAIAKLIDDWLGKQGLVN